MNKAKRFLKLMTLASAFLLVTPLASCSSFFQTDTGTSIKEVITETLPNGDTKITIKYVEDADMDDVSFIVPKGDKGDKGNGIADIKQELNKEGTIVTLTITFTDSEIEPLVFEIPVISGTDGVSIKSITNKVDEETLDTVVTITFEDDKLAPVVFTIPKGKEGNGIASIVPEVDENDNIKVTITYTDKDREPLVFIIPKGEKGDTGKGIFGVRQEETDDAILIYFIDTEGNEFIPVKIQKPQTPNTWISGTVDPLQTQGKDGDFYINTDSLEIYQKEEGAWILIATLSKQETKFTVTFDLNVDDASAQLQGNASYKIRNGQTFYAERKINPSISIPKATREGYEFLGWYTGSDQADLSLGKFTDLTPVVCDMTLFAWWEPTV